MPIIPYLILAYLGVLILAAIVFMALGIWFNHQLIRTLNAPEKGAL